MTLTGFDPTVVSTSINAVVSAYNELMQALGSDMQNQFVGGMADKWACNEAINFFTNAFKPSVDELISQSDTIFSSVVQSMNSAAQEWASRTQTSYSPISFTPNNVKMDVSSISENIGGVRGIDAANAGTVVAHLATIATSAEAALTHAQAAVQSCGFIGGNQASSLYGSLGTIKSKIQTATNNLTNDTKTAIDNTVSAYGDLEGQVAQAFSATE